MTALKQHMIDAETKAWDALSRYKFVMFGYWAGVWVHLNQIDGRRAPNPFKSAVALAKEVVATPPLCCSYGPHSKCTGGKEKACRKEGGFLQFARHGGDLD